MSKKIASTCLPDFLSKYLFYLKKDEMFMTEVVRMCLNKKKNLIDFDPDFNYQGLEVKKEIRTTFILERRF